MRPSQWNPVRLTALLVEVVLRVIRLPDGAGRVFGQQRIARAVGKARRPRWARCPFASLTNNNGLRGEIAETLVALPSGEDDDQPDEVEQDAVDQAKYRTD